MAGRDHGEEDGSKSCGHAGPEQESWPGNEAEGEFGDIFSRIKSGVGDVFSRPPKQ